MYCHNCHVGLSDGDFFIARSSMSFAWVICHMLTMSPNLISLFHRDLFYVLGDVRFYLDVSCWATCYVVASPLWHVVIGSLVDSYFFSEIFILIGKYHVLCMYYDETVHNWRLWCLPSSVVCGILFKDINSCSVIWSPSMNSAGRPHFHVPCPACVLFWLSRSGTATHFVNVFTLFIIVNIAAEEPRVEHAVAAFCMYVFESMCVSLLECEGL